MYSRWESEDRLRSWSFHKLEPEKKGTPMKTTATRLGLGVPMRPTVKQIMTASVYRPDPQGEQRRRSIRAVIKLVLNFYAPEVLPDHIRDLIDTMLWKLTEADGKYNTRYRSQVALNSSGKLIHEHVYPKKQMIDRLVDAGSEREIDELLGAGRYCMCGNRRGAPSPATRRLGLGSLPRRENSRHRHCDRREGDINEPGLQHQRCR
jgi:hypothetical protein